MIKIMGIFVLAVLPTVVITSGVTPQNEFEAGLLKLIDKAKTGDFQSLQFPSLTPLKLPHAKFNYDDYTMSISELKVKGLVNLSVEKLSTSPSDLKISMEIFVPTLAIRADRYHLKSQPIFFGFRVINNKGTLRSTVNNLRLWFDIHFEADGGDTIITDLNLDYSVDGVKVQLSGSPWLVNQKVNEEISNMITDSETRGRIRDLIQDMTSRYLRGHTPQEFIKMISSMST